MQAMEQKIQLVAGLLGTDLSGTAETQPQLTGLQTTPYAAGPLQGNVSGSVMQQLADVRTELSRLTQSQQRLSSLPHNSADLSDELTKLMHRLERQESEVAQLRQAQSNALQQANELQQGLTAQDIVSGELQQAQQSLSSTLGSINDDLCRRVNDVQDTHSQLEAQRATSLSQISEEVSQHHVDLGKLSAASRGHNEQLRQHGLTQKQYEEQMASSVAFQREAQEALHRLSEHTDAAGSSVRSGAHSSTGVCACVRVCGLDAPQLVM